MLVGAIEKLVGGLNGRTRGAPGGVLGSHSIAFGDYFAATTCYSGLPGAPFGVCLSQVGMSSRDLPPGVMVAARLPD